MPDVPPVDLSNCDREPIHIPGSVQPHGVMLVLDADRRIIQCSDSIAPLLGMAAQDAIGRPMTELFAPEDAADICHKLDDGPLQLHPVYLRSIQAAKTSAKFDAIAHRSGTLTILELEPADIQSRDGNDLHRLTQTALVDFRQPGSLTRLCDKIAIHVRKLTGFDRVMVYRFDPEWNGQVIAEAKADDLEPFFGLHYPASDIPKQARELYTKNWLRFIADRDYTPSPMVPAILPGQQPLDMSFCVLRSVSPIHLEYLRNMGVGASMSISLVSGGRLWGLIACHHYAPRRVPFEVRTACELLAQVMSLQVAAREIAEVETDVRNSNAAISRVLAAMDAGERFADTLADVGDDLLGVVHAGGVAIVDDRQVLRVGQTPSEQRISEIVTAIATAGDQDIFATDNLRAILGGGTLDPVASGVLAIRPTRMGRRWVLWFRGEQLRTVHWAGDPAKTVSKGEDARLSPRGSFALWKQTVTGRSLPWTHGELAAAEELRRAMLSKVLAHAEDLARNNIELRRSSSEKEQQLDSERAARGEAERLGKMKDDFVATLSHELRTPLTAIQGWAHLLRSTSQTKDGYDEGLEIIERNARAQAQMVEDLLDMSRITAGKLSLDVQPVQLPQVIEGAVAAVEIAAAAKGIRIQQTLDPMLGIAVTGDPHRLQQVLWNLLNNAMKFTPKGGRVTIVLKRVSSHVELSVSDSGVGIPADFLPHVFDRFRQADASYARQFGGLGLGLAIVRSLIEMHGGSVSVDSAGPNLGTTFTVTLPVRAVTQDETNNHPRISTGGALNCDDLQLGGVNVLVVDDEPDTRELVRRVLTECGVNVTTATGAAEGLLALENRSFDVLVSDIGMPGEDGYSLIRKVRELEARQNRAKMPALALTAYARAQDRQRIMLAGFQVHVAKPVEAAELLATVASLAGRI
ncbi:MAG: cph [Phycisphaerales bacterium]|nr:cph [Phycisphaerales bacterium]